MPKEFDEISINTDPFKVPKGELITYERVVELAYPEGTGQRYSVTYRRGPSQNEQGSLSPGGSVKVKNKMIFDVTPSTRS